MPSINELLSQSQNLPNIPEVVRELIQTFNQPDPDLLEVANKVSKDPVISVKLLRLANSARFGCSREVATAKEATVRLGLATVRNMVLASGLVDSMKPIPGIDLKHFWAHVFDVAELSKKLAAFLKLPPEPVFTCALMHNIGRLIMHAGLPANMAERISNLEPLKGRVTAEINTVGFSYPEVGAELAERWNFPTFIGLAIRHHYSPMKAQPFCQEAAIIQLAIELLTVPENLDEPPAGWPEEVAKSLNLDWADCKIVLAQFREQGNGYQALIAA